MKKLSRLLGLTDEAPKPGHWLEGLRNAGTTNVPATTGDVNTSGLERMLNQPIDRRTFMEKTGQAAQAASMAGRLGGALENVLPQVVEAAPEVTWPSTGAEYLRTVFDDQFKKLSPKKRKFLEEDLAEEAMYAAEVGDPPPKLSDVLLDELDDIKLTNPADRLGSVDEIVEHILKMKDDLGDDGTDEFNAVLSRMRGLGLRGKKHKKLPDLWEIKDALWAAQLRRADLIEERRKLQFPNGDE